MRVLVTGGGGFIGSEIVKNLIADGASVTVLSRSGKAPVGAEGVRGDVSDPAGLAAALAGIDAIVHCVGIILEPKGITFEKVVAEGTRNLVNAAKKVGVRKFIYISALGTRPNAVSRYHQTKWEAEEAIRASGIDFTILRPSTVYGPDDHFLNWFLKLPFIPLPGGGKALFEPTYVRDLAEMVRISLSEASASNQTFDAGGPDRLSFREMMSVTLEAAGKRKLMIPIPMPLMRLIAAFHDPFQRILLPLALFTNDQYRMLQEDNIGDNSALTSAMPELKLTPFRQGLSSYLGHR